MPCAAAKVSREHRLASVMAAGACDLGPRYRLLRPLGKGGMGEVFLVRDCYLDRELALKLLHRPPGDAEELEAARREFTLLSQLEHPGIARAHDFGLTGGRPFFTSEYIAGVSLDATSPPVGGDGLLAVFRELAEALAFLHRSEVLHLDIKPSNIIAAGGGEGGRRPVLIDFGLCRRGSARRPGSELRGSLAYMAPEYFRDERLGPWTDVYAFGVTLYRLATGAWPRPGAAAALERAAGAWTPAPPPPSQLRSGLPRDLDGIALRCLALDPGARFASGVELRDALGALAPAAGGSPGPRSPGALTVGRAAEMEAACRFLRGIESGAATPALLLTAAPGFGQSHFLRDIKARAQALGFHAYLETGYAGRAGPPGSILRSLAHHLDPGAGAARRWQAFLRRMARPRRPSANESSESERRLRRAAEAVLAVEALRERLLLIADGLQFFDEVSIALVLDVVRHLLSLEPARRPPLAAVLAYREEGPARRLLSELTACLLAARGEAIALRPLDVDETRRLHESRDGVEPEPEALRRASSMPVERPRIRRLPTRGGSPAARNGPRSSPSSSSTARRAPPSWRGSSPWPRAGSSASCTPPWRAARSRPPSGPPAASGWPAPRRGASTSRGPRSAPSTSASAACWSPARERRTIRGASRRRGTSRAAGRAPSSSATVSPPPAT
jgi:hypothetical protein